MVPPSNYEAMFAPEDKDKAIVVTPYGRGMVLRTRRDQNVRMREIELTDWVKPETQKGPRRPSTLFSPTDFPSVAPKVGDDVKTTYGRGTVADIRDDGVLVVRISSWRLAGRSMVTCYLSPDDSNLQVVQPHKIFEMSVYEKVEHAQKIKADAAARFATKEYSEALELYAKTVDTVRYVQHKKDSSNELRADLLVVMITSCNNAATCCIQLQDWDRAQKFGKNALVLLEALYEKKSNSKIHALLNRDGLGDSQLFGTWQVKSYIVIARGLAEKYHTEEALEHLKKGLDMVAMFKKEGDAMFQQLASQEKQIRKLFTACRERLKAEKKKQKKAAIKMFSSSSEEKKDSEKEPGRQTVPETSKSMAVEKKVVENDPAEEMSPEATDSTTPNNEMESGNPILASRRKGLKKQVSFADGSKPGTVDDDIGPSFWEENVEALIILAGVALGSAFVHLAFRRRR
jgi:tetratricopeptide (TPR) repeat protein